MGLAHLSYEAFGAAVNEVVPAHIASQVGLNAPNNPEAHMAVLSLLAKEKVTDPREAAAITRQALADGFGTAESHQLSMLGDEPQQSLYVPIARITAAAAKRLREEKRTFKVLTEKSGKIEAAGNVLDKAANESKVISNEEALAILDRTAHSAGPVRDALVRAARSELSGARRSDAVGQFLDELGSIDLRAAAAGVGPDGRFSEPSGGAGRDLAFEAADDNLPRGSEPSLFDRAVSARDAAEPFSDPVSPEAKQQADLLEHDLREDAGMPERPKGEYDGSLKRTASWVVRNKDTGEVVMETFDKRVVDALNTAKYEAVPIGEYLGSINGREKAPETPAQTEAPPDSAQAAKPSENASGESTEHLFDLPETGFRLSEEGRAGFAEGSTQPSRGR
jgi:hypothetical protein